VQRWHNIVPRLPSGAAIAPITPSYVASNRLTACPINDGLRKRHGTDEIKKQLGLVYTPFSLIGGSLRSNTVIG
jgi:hypothetical protein